MKKIYVFFISACLALGAVSCKKDDNSSSNNNNNTNNNNNNTIDVWGTGMGTYTGTISFSNGDPDIPNQKLVLTKVNDFKIHVAPGSGNTFAMTARDIDIFKGDSTILSQQGAFNGSIAVYVTRNKTAQVVYDDKVTNYTFLGDK